MEIVIDLPHGVTVTVEGRKAVVTGPLGTVEKTFSDPRFNRFVSITVSESSIKIAYTDDWRKIRAYAGTTAAHIKNMIIGVTYGWRYEMKVFFTHFPISLEQKGSDILVKNFLGEKSMRHAKILGKTKVELGKDQIAVVGIDKEDVSQTAANIETSTRLSGKDRRVFLDGLYITGCNHGREK